MKKLVLALVLGNLAFFGWQVFGRPKPEAVLAMPQETTARNLVLLSELPPDQQPAPRAPLIPDELPAGVAETPSAQEATPVAARADSPAPPPFACFHMAGFPSIASAARSRVQLERAGASVGPAIAERYARSRYWVLLPPSRTPAQATGLVERLKRAGVKDYYLIPDGPNQNAISLGVFSTQEGARRRVADMAGLKLKVRVEKVDYPGRRFALDVRWPATATIDWRGRVSPGVEIANTGCAAQP